MQDMRQTGRKLRTHLQNRRFKEQNRNLSTHNSEYRFLFTSVFPAFRLHLAKYSEILAIL